MAVQDFYPDDLAHCYGCGRLNAHGLHVRSAWDGDQTVAVLRPRPEHTAIPGFVYGGLIASLIDCHGTGSAALAAYRAADRAPGSDPPLRFVTASLNVDYLRPTPMGVPLEARGRIVEIKPRKVVVDIDVRVAARACETGAPRSAPDVCRTEVQDAAAEICARGRVVAVLMPPTFGQSGGV